MCAVSTMYMLKDTHDVTVSKEHFFILVKIILINNANNCLFDTVNHNIRRRI